MFKWLTRRRPAHQSSPAPKEQTPHVPAARASVAGAKNDSERYFALHERIQMAHKTRDYREVARLARQTYDLLPTFVMAWKREYGRWDIQTCVAVHTGGTVLAVLEDEQGVEHLQRTLAAVDELRPWRPVGDAAAADLAIVRRLLPLVATRPGIRQTELRKLLPDADGRRVATLASWLEKAGRLHRLRNGKDYELSIGATK
jgi:hypothetical protein